MKTPEKPSPDSSNPWKAPKAISATPSFHARRAAFDLPATGELPRKPSSPAVELDLDFGLRTPHASARTKREAAEQLTSPASAKKTKTEDGDGSPTNNARAPLMAPGAAASSPRRSIAEESDVDFVKTVVLQLEGYNPTEAKRLKCLLMSEKNNESFSPETRRILQDHSQKLEALARSAEACHGGIQGLSDATEEEKADAQRVERSLRARCDVLKTCIASMKFA